MYLLIIAEDEYTTRRALTKVVPWNELGFQLEESFADGSGVLEYLKNNIPDVILTDIKMTSVDGMEIARYVMEQRIPTKVVFLSAYAEFSFAQKAMEYGVDYYLLKPVDMSKLRGVFEKIKEELDQKAIQESQQRECLERYSKLIEYERQQLVTDAYFGLIKNPNLLEKRLDLIQGFGTEKSENCLSIIEIVLRNDIDYQKYIEEYGHQVLEEQLTYLLNCIDHHLEFYPIIWNLNKKENLRILGVFWGNDSDSLARCQPDKVKCEIKNWTSINVDITFIKQLNSLGDLAFMEKELHPPEMQGLQVNVASYQEFINEQRKLLCSLLIQNDLEAGMELSNSLADNCLRIGLEFAKSQLVSVIVRLIDEIAHDDLQFKNQMHAGCMEESIENLGERELKNWFKINVAYLFEKANNRSEYEEVTSVEKIMNYLRGNYNKDITLTSLSESLYLNPTYISRLIKKKLGKNYSEILMELRVEHAIALLKTTELNMYDIAERVGYSNLKYFYKVFKKITGKTPGDFRGKRL